MLTEDYFMRMINQAIYVLKKIMGLKTTGHNQEALHEIGQMLEVLLGMNAELLKRLDDQSILDALTQQGRLDLDRLYVIAELYREEGEILAATGLSEDGLLSSLRALSFHLEIALQGGTEMFPPAHEQIDQLLERLKEIDLPTTILYPLSGYLEEQGRYREAGTALDRLAQDPEVLTEARHVQADFYRRLLEKSSQDLERSGMSVHEIKERLDKLESLN
jgi:hypothetical protein